MSLYRLAESDFSDDEWKQEIAHVLEVILERAKPFCVAIFGSSTSGNRTAESDLDIAVLFEDKQGVAAATKDILAGAPFRRIPVDLVVMSRADFIDSERKGGIGDVIRKSGTVIFGSLPGVTKNP